MITKSDLPEHATWQFRIDTFLVIVPKLEKLLKQGIFDQWYPDIVDARPCERSVWVWQEQNFRMGDVFRGYVNQSAIERGYPYGVEFCFYEELRLLPDLPAVENSSPVPFGFSTNIWEAFIRNGVPFRDRLNELRFGAGYKGRT